MKAEEIRTEAIERVARADYMRRYRAEGFMWETTTEAIRGQHRATASLAVDALGDLLPTQLEEDGGYIIRNTGLDIVHVEPTQRRYVTEWRRVVK